MADHTERAHSVWSASATERNWSCAGALALTKDLPERTSEAADWGTCCHQIAETCLREGRQADEWIGQTVKGKKFEFECDEEMAETTQVYVDYVRKRVIEAAPKGVNPASLLRIEQKFSLAPLNPPFDAGGTGDALVYFPLIEELEIIDLKGGRGVRVSAVENKQLRTYALGAMLASRSLKVKTIRSTIIQPRTSAEPKSEVFHIADLVEWTGELMQAMRRSADALAAYNGGNPKEASIGAWNTMWLTPGDHCAKTFCGAAGFCPALRQKAYDAAGVWFDDLDQPRLANSPSDLSPEQAAQVLTAADLMSDWINAVRAYWHAQAESGVEIPDHILVDKVGREAWIDGVEAQVIAAAQKAGLDQAKYLNPGKLKTPKQIRKALGSANEKLVAGLSAAPDKGTNLVRADKTTRPAAKPAVSKHFDILD